MTDSHLVKSIAYHESGHIVVAAVLGRPLRSSGIHIDCVNRGIAFYAQRKPKVDYSGPCAGTKMDTMIAAYAGLPAQQIFYRECPVHCADGDEEFIRDLLASADDDDFADLASEEMQTRIKLQAKTLVNKHSVVIKEVAEELWATPCTNRNEQDEPNPTWSKSKMEKTLGGKRLLEILEKFGIQAFVWDPGPRIAPAE